MPNRTNRSNSVSQAAPLDEAAIEAIMEKVCSKFFSKLEVKIEKITENIKKLSDNLQKTEKLAVQNQKNIETINSQLDESHQFSKRNSLRITGLKESEELLDNVLNLINATLKVKCNNSDINNLYRIGRMSQENNIPRNVLIDFTSYIKRTEILNARRLLQGTGIFINEELTPRRYNLLKMAKKKYGSRNVWSLDGKIFTVNNEGVKKHLTAI